MAENVKEEGKMEDIEIKEETQEEILSSTVEDVCTVENTCTVENVCTAENTCTVEDVCTVENTCTAEDVCTAENTCTVEDVCTAENTCTVEDVCTIYAKEEDFKMREDFKTEETEGKP